MAFLQSSKTSSHVISIVWLVLLKPPCLQEAYYQQLKIMFMRNAINRCVVYNKKQTNQNKQRKSLPHLFRNRMRVEILYNNSLFSSIDLKFLNLFFSYTCAALLYILKVSLIEGALLSFDARMYIIFICQIT